MPRSLVRVLLRQDLRRTSSAPAVRCVAPPRARSRRKPPPCRSQCGSLAADRNPYADAAAPYKVDRVQASGKFPEPLLNTPKTLTVLSKEVLATRTPPRCVRSALHRRRDAGVGRGRQAFGDRFFIRGFDARNDVFIDGIRDPAVSIRENFFTEQIEILRGPASSMPAAAPPAAPSTSSPSRRVIVTSTTAIARSAPTTPNASRRSQTR